jgi:hypothetical protein
MMGKLVFPTVGEPFPGKRGMFTWVMSGGGPIRGFPRGLDVMSVLGSKRAREILRELDDDAYENYDKVLADLKREFEGLTQRDWNRNLYWSWLYALKALLREYPKGYQTFMRTKAWQDRYLTSALASWSELRHDTILYAKQSYTLILKGVPPRPPGYVEPVPEFFARLLALSRMTKKGLEEMKVISKKAGLRLKKLENIIEKLLEISKKELENKEVDQRECRFLRRFAKELQEACGPKGKIRSRSEVKTTLIADVHTDQNTSQVLEEGVGYCDLLITACMLPNSEIALYAGPVLSYYEFKRPMRDRLTDEKWQEMLKEGNTPPRPEWTKSYMAE